MIGPTEIAELLDDIRRRLTAIETRLDAVESGVRAVDSRTTGSIRLGPRPVDARDEAERFNRAMAQVASAIASDRLTTDATDPRLGHGSDETPRPQNDVYLVLSPEDLAKGFVQPLRDTYRHTACGRTTTMGTVIAATYASNPWFYGSTYCCTCEKHRPLAEFTWLDGSPMSPSLWSPETRAAVQERIAARGKAQP